MTTSVTTPWLPFTFNFPSGDVDLGGVLSPRISVSYAGNAAIERDVVENVASFGKQIGIVSDAVLELAGGKAGTAVARLKEIVEQVEAVKERRRRDVKRDAEEAIERLAKSDKDELVVLLRRYAT